MVVTTAIGILQRKPVIMRCSPADQRRQTDKGDHNKTFAGALLLLQLRHINCRLSVVLSSTTYAQSFKYPPYLAQIKTTPLKESSVDHAALCGVWRRHMVVLHTHHNISDITTCVVRDSASVCANIPNTRIADNTYCWKSGCHSERSLTLWDNALWGGREVITKLSKHRHSHNCGHMPCT